MSPERATRRVLIVEPRVSGHLLVYVRLLAQRSLDRGDQVTLALCQDAFDSQEFAFHLAALAPSVTIVVAVLPLTGRRLTEMARTANADVVVVPHGDELAARLGMPLRSTPKISTRLLVMRDPRWDQGQGGGLAMSAKSRLKLMLLRRASRRRRVDLVWLRGPLAEAVPGEVHVVDPFIADGATIDIVRAGESLRETLPQPSAFWFGVTGAVSRRKNLDLVVASLLEVKQSDPTLDVGLAVVGQIDDDVQQMFLEGQATLDRYGVHTWFEDRMLSNRQMNDIVAALDAVVMAYSTSAPNSTLGKAYVLGTTIISSGSTTFQQYAEAVGGETAALDMAELADAMRRAILRRGREMAVHPEALASEAFADGLLAPEMNT